MSTELDEVLLRWLLGKKEEEGQGARCWPTERKKMGKAGALEKNDAQRVRSLATEIPAMWLVRSVLAEARVGQG